MRQHPAVKKIVSRIATTAALGLPLFSFNGGQALAQDAPVNVARVSFVQGSVQLLAGQGTDFQQAVMNMPVIDGSRVQTGADGEAEIEFGDGSVARITPNSALQFDHLGTDQVQLEQLSGLAYYELNVGEGHAPFGLQLANIEVQPTANSILRVGMDAGWEVAVINGSVSVQGNGIPPVNVAENQSVRSGGGNDGAPYTVAQGINGDSWDNWNQDRDQAIAQEAAQQTPVRDDSANPQSENWNDLGCGRQLVSRRGFRQCLGARRGRPRTGTPTEPVIGGTTQPLAIRGSPLTHGAGCPITMGHGTTIPLAGAGPLVAAAAGPP